MNTPGWLLAKPFAHRGLHDRDRPENSLTAIDAAITAGFPVEIDVQESADGRAIVFHDWHLQRLTGRDGWVHRLPAAEIQQLALLETGQKVPVLEEVLEVIAGRVPLLIEIKQCQRRSALEPEIACVLQSYRGSFAIQSFNPFCLGWFRRHHPEILRGQISCAFDTDERAGWKKCLLKNYALNWLSQPHFLADDWRRLPTPATTLLRRFFQLPLLAWTVRSANERAAVLRWADNVIFEGFRPPAGEISTDVSRQTPRADFST